MSTAVLFGGTSYYNLEDWGRKREWEKIKKRLKKRKLHQKLSLSFLWLLLNPNFSCWRDEKKKGGGGCNYERIFEDAHSSASAMVSWKLLIFFLFYAQNSTSFFLYQEECFFYFNDMVFLPLKIASDSELNLAFFFLFLLLLPTTTTIYIC